MDQMDVDTKKRSRSRSPSPSSREAKRARSEDVSEPSATAEAQAVVTAVADVDAPTLEAVTSPINDGYCAVFKTNVPKAGVLVYFAQNKDRLLKIVSVLNGLKDKEPSMHAENVLTLVHHLLPRMLGAVNETTITELGKTLVHDAISAIQDLGPTISDDACTVVEQVTFAAFARLVCVYDISSLPATQRTLEISD